MSASALGEQFHAIIWTQQLAAVMEITRLVHKSPHHVAFALSRSSGALSSSPPRRFPDVYLRDVTDVRVRVVDFYSHCQGQIRQGRGGALVGRPPLCEARRDQARTGAGRDAGAREHAAEDGRPGFAAGWPTSLAPLPYCAQTWSLPNVWPTLCVALCRQQLGVSLVPHIRTLVYMRRRNFTPLVLFHRTGASFARPHPPRLGLIRPCPVARRTIPAHRAIGPY